MVCFSILECLKSTCIPWVSIGGRSHWSKYLILTATLLCTQSSLVCALKQETNFLVTHPVVSMPSEVGHYIQIPLPMAVGFITFFHGKKSVGKLIC